MVSFSLLAFEITLSRLLSVLLSYHYSFMVLSLALLGLGLGGLLAQYLRFDRKYGLSLSSNIYSLTLVITILFFIVAHGQASDSLAHACVYGMFLLLPFLAAGMLLAQAYRAYSFASAKIYGADLIGGACGSLGMVPLMSLGGIGSGFILCIISALAGIFFSRAELPPKSLGRRSSVALLTLTLCLALANLSGVFEPEIVIARNAAKEIYTAVNQFKGKILTTRWSAFGRTDLVGFADYKDHMDIYLDGTAGSPMYRYSGRPHDPGTEVQNLKRSFPGYFPFRCLKPHEKKSILIIGPGGGRDILLALMGGVQKITAVEINKDLVNLVRDYAAYNGGIYNRSERVEVIIEEGRHFLKRSFRQYELIMLSLPVTNTSRSLEGFALTENFLFTMESLSDYLDHLTVDGRLIVVTHHEIEALRLLSIALALFKQKGESQTSALKKMYLVGNSDYQVFVLKKTPFNEYGVLDRYQAMLESGLNPSTAYFPLIKKPGAINPVLMALGNGKLSIGAFQEMIASRGYDVSPVTDDRPFFYKFEPGIPDTIRAVFWVSLGMFLFMAATFFLSLQRGAHSPGLADFPRGMRRTSILTGLIIFPLLGMGFMITEIALIQKLSLFLGRPVFALMTILGSLLTGAGLGGLWSGRIRPDKMGKGISLAALIAGLIIWAYAMILPYFVNALLHLPFITRLLLLMALLLPLGFFLGISFPLGIRFLGESQFKSAIPLAWGVNGVSSVLGSVLTLIIAMSLGFTAALMVASGCYLLISVSALALKQ